tara:strand:+ start:1217 stop:1672 length:456 start_codon:yes stop_codon:yes gene_type:complete
MLPSTLFAVLIYTIKSSVSGNSSIFPTAEILALASNETLPSTPAGIVPETLMTALATTLEDANLLAIASALDIVAVATIDATPRFLTVATMEVEMEPEIDVAAFFLTSPVAETTTDAEILAAPEMTALDPENGVDENGAAEKLIYDSPSYS